MSRTVMAHIEKVVQTYPIEGADNIEMCQILDYHVVVKKSDNIKPNDLVVYIEVDSILPEKPEFEFLRSKKFKIKAMKYGKFKNSVGDPIVSFGIIFPTSILPSEIVPTEGMDLTEILGVQKVIEDPEELNQNSETDKPKNFLEKKLMRYSWYRKMKKLIKGSKIKGSWLPIFPSQSDEENAQKIYSKLILNHGRENYYISEKCEGQNLSFYLINTKSFFGLFNTKHFGVCSRTRNLVTNDGSDFWKTAIEVDAENKLRKVGKNIFVRGERCAPRLQGNIYGFKSNRFFVFDVYDLDTKRLYTLNEMIEFCNKYGFDHVPILDDNFTLPETVDEILKMSNGYSVFGEKVLREGIVIRKKDNPTVSFKARSPEYLIKQKI